jgi:cyclopropane fatty-acyl-phospholipid synthase-like methyltransferase
MNFDWNSNTIRWYQEANKYSGFFKNIAELIAPGLKDHSTLCDIGCGLGLVDLELSTHIKNITCIDINKEAIKALQKSVKDRKITNIEPRLMDCKDIDENWDVIYISFFGSRNLEEYLPRCKKLIAVVGKKNQTELYPEKYRTFQKNTSDEVEQALTNKGITYFLREVSFEFGQPLSSLEEAKNFVTTHSPQISPKDLADFLAQRLIETGEQQYPFFLPRMKAMGIFEIEGEL